MVHLVIQKKNIHQFFFFNIYSNKFFMVMNCMGENILTRWFDCVLRFTFHIFIEAYKA